MKERGIIFSAPMVRALLEGRKGQTRRICKAKLYEPLMERGFAPGIGIWRGADNSEVRCPYGTPENKLWVRETWRPLWASLGEGTEVEYRSDSATVVHPVCAKPLITDDRWRPSIFMPRWASRLTLEITEVRVERLADISEEDARAEGVERVHGDLFGVEGVIPFEHHYPQDAYASLWESIHGPGSWGASPWVWAISFRVLTQEVKR
jgi:hypothetical protein